MTLKFKIIFLLTVMSLINISCRPSNNEINIKFFEDVSNIKFPKDIKAFETFDNSEYICLGVFKISKDNFEYFKSKATFKQLQKNNALNSYYSSFQNNYLKDKKNSFSPGPAIVEWRKCYKCAEINIYIDTVALKMWCVSLYPDNSGDFCCNETTEEQVTCVSTINGQFKIDTGNILINKNLPTLSQDLNKADLVDKKNVADIPTFIKAFLDSISDDKDFSIANPDENWRVGCTDLIIVDKKGKALNTKLATKQLVYFGLGKSIALFSYYTGGIGKSQHIAIIKFQDKKVIDFWFKNGIPFVSTKDELLKIVIQQTGQKGAA